MGEVEDLLAAAEECLEAAKLLGSHGFHPAAVNRAYYAILYAARAALASRGVTAKTHGGVLHRFGEVFTGPGLLPRDLAAAFGKAMEVRSRADYFTGRRPSRLQSEAVMRDARRFVEVVRRFLREG